MTDLCREQNDGEHVADNVARKCRYVNVAM